MSVMTALPLVPDRACGDCNVCCVALTINDPALRKAQGYRCPNSTADHGCTIYETRPDTCRSFYCGWRMLKWVRVGLRPDLSGVLVTLSREKAAEDGSPRYGVSFTLLTVQALKAEGLAESVAAAVSGGLAVYLRVPGPPGYTSSQARINELVEHAVITKDKPALLRLLREARAKGRRGDRRPIVLDRTVGTASPSPIL